MWWILAAVVTTLVLLIKWARSTGKDQPVEGAVFVTGCDSGMGENTAFHLMRTGYHVFAGCYTKESFTKFAEFKNVTCIQIDVANEESVNSAAEEVKSTIEKSNGKIKGLYGVLQCAGIAFTAPFEYIPMKSIKRQMDVNYFGYVYVTKAFLPIVKADVTKPGARRGRFAYVSSGPLPGPGVPFITSYLGAKWAGEALCQGLRMEMRMRQLPIDCVMLSPGVVKPTMLSVHGEKLLEDTFNQMPPAATEEYRDMVNAFCKFQLEEPGTHVSEVGRQNGAYYAAWSSWLRYFVGFDAQASVLVGLLPTGLREHLLRNTLMMHYKGVP